MLKNKSLCRGLVAVGLVSFSGVHAMAKPPVLVWGDTIIARNNTAFAIIHAEDANVDVGEPLLPRHDRLTAWDEHHAPLNSFGAGGTVHFDKLGFDRLSLRDLAQQSDGKVVVLGKGDHGVAGPHSKIFLARLNSDGAFDAKFGAAGVLVIDAMADRDDTAVGLTVDAVTGTIFALTRKDGQPGHAPQDLHAYRVTPKGALDERFGKGGQLAIAPPMIADDAWHLGRVSLGYSGQRLLITGTYAKQSADDDFLFAYALALAPLTGRISKLHEDPIPLGVAWPHHNFVSVIATDDGDKLAVLQQSPTSARIFQIFSYTGKRVPLTKLQTIGIAARAPGFAITHSLRANPDHSYYAVGAITSWDPGSLLLVRFSPANEPTSYRPLRSALRYLAGLNGCQAAIRQPQ